MRYIASQYLLSMLLALASTASASPLAEATHPGARVIVKYRADPALARSTVSAEARLESQTAALARRAGVALSAIAAVSNDTQVVRAADVTSEALAATLARDPQVEYAVPDRRVQLRARPNDPYFAAGPAATGPAVGQWYLRAAVGSTVSAINAEAAWSITKGDPAIIVAVLDTGVRYDHPDLGSVTSGGKLLPGYSMISDPEVANLGGKGRVADASDPGDWVTEAESSSSSSLFYGCPARNSSWHGTVVSGIIGAWTDNGIGVAGAAPAVRILPVRVLGKCGGFESDIAAGMRWAVGLPVPGVPVNPTPARVLNMSLGGETPCSLVEAQTVAEVTALGVPVVVSAGNSIGHAVGSPANCPGALGVLALRHAGTKVGYSDLGPEIAVAAPGGNCVNTDPGTMCLYPIMAPSNAGTKVPAAASYTDGLQHPSLGTSFAAPLVAATAALALSVNPTLTVAQVRSVLQASSRPFPNSGAEDATDVGILPACQPARLDAFGKPVDQYQCYCTNGTCGAGMLAADLALQALTRRDPPVQAVEYYWPAKDHYFLTTDPSEIAKLDGGGTGWVRTGEAFSAYAQATGATSRVCRFYLPAANGDSHYFSASPEECGEVQRKFPTFVHETNTAFFVALPSATGDCPAATQPVYRLWNKRADSNHRYTAKRTLRDELVAKGYVSEGYGPAGVAMCAPIT